MKTKCIIVDDEPLAIKLIKSHVSKFDFIEVVGECKSAIQAIDVLRTVNIDLMFLDINMPKITGLEFLKSLPHPPYVIITTAYREYALEGFDLNVVDYLLKPISFERFLKAINKYCERLAKNINLETTVSDSEIKKTFIYVQDGKTIHKINLDDILYFEGYGEYVKIHTIQKTYLSKETMHEYESNLHINHFIRTHKSYIASINKINAFTSTTILIQDKEIPIGRSYKESVNQTIAYSKK
ncbi:MAG: LytTR family DNA-binding domain-containing protein [Bacteroidetes bacterium]|nr:LytTR family DNA-binding domain-containing protein [Bacteroidota bacterium]